MGWGHFPGVGEGRRFHGVHFALWADITRALFLRGGGRFSQGANFGGQISRGTFQGGGADFREADFLITINTKQTKVQNGKHKALK